MRKKAKRLLPRNLERSSCLILMSFMALTYHNFLGIAVVKVESSGFWIVISVTKTTLNC